MLKRISHVTTMTTLALAGLVWNGAGRSQQPAPLPCEPGYTLVPEICYRDCIKKVAVPVPDVKKITRWVCTNRVEDFAVPRCHCPLCCKDDCGCCTICGKPCCRAPLIKHKIVEEVPTTKCEVECTFEKVAYIVYRKVPCGQAPSIEVPLMRMPPGGLVPEIVPPPQPQRPFMPPAPVSAPQQPQAVIHVD